MPRNNRVDVAGEIYHVINRANARMKIWVEKVIDKYKLGSTLRNHGRPKKAPDPIILFLFLFL